MADTKQADVKIDARAYPIVEPKGSTVAFASVTINDMIAINGIRVVNGEKGLFAAMPQTKDANGEYRDICFPVTAELRKQLNKTVLETYEAAVQEKASTVDKLRDAKDAPAPAPAAEKDKSAKKKANPEH